MSKFYVPPMGYMADYGFVVEMIDGQFAGIFSRVNAVHLAKAGGQFGFWRIKAPRRG